MGNRLDDLNERDGDTPLELVLQILTNAIAYPAFNLTSAKYLEESLIKQRSSM
jgi:hypothetical protein